MLRIFVCSPLRGDGTPAAYARNMELAAGYCRDVLSVGCVPVAGHLFYPRFLDDTNPEERALGIALGQFDMASCDALWFWSGPNGLLSEGMKSDIATAERYGVPAYEGRSMVDGLRAMGTPGYVATPEALMGAYPMPSGRIMPGALTITRFTAAAIRRAYQREGAPDGVVIV